MQHTPENIVGGWLLKLGFDVSYGLIKQQIKSHPDYPSLLSITDTLDYLGIENAAVEIEKNQLHEIDTPFLAHLKTNGGEFVIAENRDTLDAVYPGFFENWSGVVVVVEKKENWSHKENSNWLKKERQTAERRNSAIALGVILSGTAIALSSGWIIPSLVLIAAAGIFISWLIISKQLGIENKVADRVCGQQADCDTIIRSGNVKLPFGASFGDISITWFSSLLFILLLSSVLPDQRGILAILSFLAAVAIPVTVFSVYYQWRVAKKWCRLCLITAGLLWVQFAALLTPLLTASWQAIKTREVFFISAGITLLGIAWFFLKQTLVQNKKFEQEFLAGLQFKRNESVFTALLEKQRRVNITPWENDFQLGNADAPLQITVACNPFCGPCASAHEKLHELLENLGDKIGLIVRFTVNTKNNTDNRTQAVQYMLQKMISITEAMRDSEKVIYAKQMLHDWFRYMSFEKFKSEYPLAGETDVSNILSRHEAWMKRSKIAFTPTVFINGFEMPKQYSIEDLPGFISSLLNISVEENLETKLKSITEMI